MADGSVQSGADATRNSKQISFEQWLAVENHLHKANAIIRATGKAIHEELGSPDANDFTGSLWAASDYLDAITAILYTERRAP